MMRGKRIVEKPIYPSSNMRITQGYNEGTHMDSYALDDAGIDSGISTLKAPFTGIIKKIYSADANEVWLESIEEVEYPDGTIDYMTIMFAHSNNVDNLFVGKKISQGAPFYSEGTKGQATGNHCHIECGKGKFKGTGWHKNNAGYYSINNGKKPEECLWLDNTINVIDNHGYTFRTIPQEPPTTAAPTEPSTQPPITPLSTVPKLIYTCQKDDLYGIYLKKGDKLYLEKKEV